MTESATEPVLTEQRENVLVITINRPEARNAVNRAVSEGMAEALERLDAEEGLAAGVVRGEGKGFSAGMDLKAFAEGEFPHIEGRGFAGIAERAADKPLIAAVEGFALAGGCEIALACDLIVASRGAKFGIPESTVGLAAVAGALLRLPKKIPLGVAMEMALTGKPQSAERMAELGMVNRLVEPGEATDAAVEWAGEIAKNAPLSLRVSKQILQRQHAWSEEEMWAKQGELAGPVFVSKDAREGAKAFAEKREPVWRGE